ncbi:MAG TPA: hypothetical protein VJA21_33745 [Verrucomicrobiae bacterium]
MYIGLAKAEQARANVKKALVAERIESFAARRLFDTVPFIFTAAPDCTEWKVRTAEFLAVDPCSVFIIGSACSCVSFNPNKNFKVFDEGRPSDIDIAVISNYHFELAWRKLREIGAGKYNLDTAGQASLAEHRDHHVFWGMFATEKILSALPFSQEWLRASVEISKRAPMEGREIKFRLYRDSYSFVAYHLNGLKSLRAQLTSATQSGK